MTNLTVEEQALISNMNKRLKTLELLLDEALEKETPETLKQWLASKRKNRTCNNNCSDVCGECQPAAKDEYSPFGTKLKDAIDTTEGEVEYKKMLTESMMNITKGKIYKCYYQNGEDAYTLIDDTGKIDKGWDVGCFEHKTYTHAEFLAQEQAPIETEQRWKPKLGEKYWVISMTFDFQIGWLLWDNYLDDKYYKSGNCFKTEQEAQKAAEAIKQYLSTNKF
jgi:hypothetical protein